MSQPEPSKKQKINLSIEQCVEQAQELLKTADAVLLCFDVIGSSRMTNYSKAQDKLRNILSEAYTKFATSMPSNVLRNGFDSDSGFVIISGDCIVGGVNDAAKIPEIIEFIETQSDPIKLRKAIAKDGWEPVFRRL